MIIIDNNNNTNNRILLPAGNQKVLDSIVVKFIFVGCCGVVTHSFSDPWVMGSNPSTAYFHIIVHNKPSAS